MIANIRSILVVLIRSQSWFAKLVKVQGYTVAVIMFLVPLLVLWWQSVRFGFLRGLLEIVLALVISALLWYVVVQLTGVFRRMLRRFHIGLVRDALLRHKRAITLMAVCFLLFVPLPIMILLRVDRSFTLGEFVVRYISHLLVSVVLLGIIGYTGKRLIGDESLNDMLLAYDQDEISEVTVKEVEQAESLKKWIKQGDIIGWYELQEEVRYGGGLRPRARLVVERELWEVQHQRRSNGKFEKQLQSLLSIEQV